MPITNSPYSVLPYLASKSAYTTTGSNFYTVPSTAGGADVAGVYVYLWGAGGQRTYRWSTPDGGGGGFVSGFYRCNPGTNLLYVVGAVGGGSIATGGGGTATTGETPGGGFSGIFLSNAGALVQSNAIAIAGGGGGGGWGQGGAGGYPAGGNGNQYDAIAFGYGGTQTAGGARGGQRGPDGTYSLPGSALTGGTAGNEGGGAPEGGGGGGWFGGGGGGNAGGGGGGSSYIGNVNGATGGIGLTSGAYYENGGDFTSGVKARPGGTTNQHYITGVGSGSNDWTQGSGLVVIIPATTVTPTGAPSTRVPLTLTPYTPLYVLSYTGNYINFTVPIKATGLSFYMWGGGGGGGADGGFATSYSGAGAYLQGRLSVIEGEQLRIIVGQGGQRNYITYYSTMTDAQGGGGAGTVQGGGRSAIQKYISNAWTEVVTAGGGGASPRTNYGGSGGNAYFTGTSQAGTGQNGASGGGQGGSASAGGAGTVNWQSSPSGIASSGGTQGFGGQAGGHSGYTLGQSIHLPGGGGGYYGGGGGWINDGGGGGGSYYNATYVTNFIGSNGNYATPVGTSAPGYVSGAGLGVTGVAPGSNGLVVFAPSYIKINFTSG